MNQGAQFGGIVCIGWGSLVWNPEGLPLCSGWHAGGPELPVEFARQSANKRMTLVICPGLLRVPTRWAVLDVPDLNSAKRALAVREWDRALKNPSWIEKYVGYWERATDSRHGMESDVIAAWGSGRGLDGVVWTNLPCRINGANQAMPSEHEVIESLSSLHGQERELAEEYVRKAPSEVDTLYRRRIVREFGWG